MFQSHGNVSEYKISKSIWVLVLGESDKKGNSTKNGGVDCETILPNLCLRKPVVLNDISSFE